MGVQNRQIGWSNESSLLQQILKQLVKLTAIIFQLKQASTPKYKVFTALVNQNGSDAPGDLQNDNLIIGVSYRITDNGGSALPGFDFTNVGAPNNDFGTSFIATGTTPTSWGVTDFYPTLTYNTGAPTARILENTLGAVSFTYIGVGDYAVNSPDLFTLGKTAVFVTTNAKLILNAIQYQAVAIIEETSLPSKFTLYTGDVLGNYLDDVIQTGYPLTLEIRVYDN